MFYLDFWYFFFVFFLRNKTFYKKFIRQARMSLETFTLRIQLYIPAFSLTRRKPLMSAMTNFVQ